MFGMLHYVETGKLIANLSNEQCKKGLFSTVKIHVSSLWQTKRNESATYSHIVLLFLSVAGTIGEHHIKRMRTQQILSASILASGKKSPSHRLFPQTIRMV